MQLREAVEILRTKAATAAQRGYVETEMRLHLAIEMLELVVASDPADGHTNGQPSTGGA